MFRLFGIGRTLLLLLLTTVSLSCVHTPPEDRHTHLSVAPLELTTPVLIQGRILDKESGEPVPYADVFLVDARPECLRQYRAHTARQGTTNRDGQVDLNAKWSTMGEIDAEQMPTSAMSWVRDMGRLAKAAEAECRAGNPVNVAIVVEEWTHHGRYVLLDTNQFASSLSGWVINLGTWELEPLPEEYWCHGDLSPASIASVESLAEIEESAQ